MNSVTQAVPYVTLGISEMGVLKVCGWEGGSDVQSCLVASWVRCSQFTGFASCRSAADRYDPSCHACRSRQRGRNARRGVHADETIGTDKAGVAGLRFHDQSTLDVGPNSSVRLNKFIYDPNRGGGKAVLDAAKGSFRFSTGAQGGNRNIQIKTPVGTLGIRG